MFNNSTIITSIHEGYSVSRINFQFCSKLLLYIHTRYRTVGSLWPFVQSHPRIKHFTQFSPRKAQLLIRRRFIIRTFDAPIRPVYASYRSNRFGPRARLNRPWISVLFRAIYILQSRILKQRKSEDRGNQVRDTASEYDGRTSGISRQIMWTARYRDFGPSKTGFCGFRSLLRLIQRKFAEVKLRRFLPSLL